MEFRILGPLEVQRDGRPLALGGGKQRTLLAALLLEANRVVSSDRLIDLLWAEPPETARKTLQVHVLQLHRLFGAERIVTDGRGYRIRVEPEELDLERFRRLVRGGGADRLERAFAIWRGPPTYAELGMPAPAAARAEVT